MHIVKFLTSEYTDPDFQYSGKYAWFLTPGLYADLSMDVKQAHKYIGIFNILENGGYVTFKNTLLAQPANAIKWIVQNDDQVFQCPETYVDTQNSTRMQDISVLKKYNENINTEIKWSSTDILNPAVTVGSLILSMVSDYLSDVDYIAWLVGNGHDETCDRLIMADSYTPAQSTNCGCSNVVTEISTCSAYTIYRDYMNNKTRESFSDLSFLHSLFTYSIEDTEYINDLLKERLSDFIRCWADIMSMSTDISSPFTCPSVQNNTDITNMATNLLQAIEWIGTDEECPHATFITFWFGQFINKITETF